MLKAALAILLALQPSSVSAKGVHCNFFITNRYSKFNSIRLAIMKADGIVIHTDEPNGYDTTKATVTKPVSFRVNVNKDGRILEIKVAKSSGDKTNDDNAMRLIQQTPSFEVDPPFEGNLEIQFRALTDEALVTIRRVD